MKQIMKQKIPKKLSIPVRILNFYQIYTKKGTKDKNQTIPLKTKILLISNRNLPCQKYELEKYEIRLPKYQQVLRQLPF